jgi:NTE family protein
VRHESKGNSNVARQITLPAYDEVGLVLQGGGALGSYQAGVFEGLAEAGIQPTWIAGISIGALNTAIIAGNAPEDRVQALRAFWQAISVQPDPVARLGSWVSASLGFGDISRKWSSVWSAARAVLEGQKAFFVPRSPFHALNGRVKGPTDLSFYDTSALRATLLQYADFDRINEGNIRVSIGAVNVRTGNLVYFDNAKMRLEPEHFMASGALPPGFPAVEIDGEYYWDGGLVSNTPLTEIVRESQHKDTLVFQVDLWSASGEMPGNFLDVSERTKDIQYSSRTRAITAFLESSQKHARMIKQLLEHVPKSVRERDPLMREAQKIADGSAINVFHLIYRNKAFEGHYKDFEFSTETMGEHWTSGLQDIRRSLSNRQWLDIPSHDIGFVTHDVHRLHESALPQRMPLTPARGERRSGTIDEMALNEAATSEPM